jgi:hypothetical protein
MTGKCMQPGMQHDLPADRIMMQDQRLGIVEQNLARHTAERTERTLHAVEPVVLLLMAIGTHMQTARITERGHEQKRFHRHAADLHPALTEVDLQLFARLRLKADCRSNGGDQLSPQRCNRAFYRAQADHDILLSRQLLPQHIRVASVTMESLAQPIRQAVQSLRS